MNCMRSATTTAMVALLASVLFGCADLGSPLPSQTLGADTAVDPSLALRFFDGVGFTDDESNAVLQLVNTASMHQLDQEIGLDVRAAKAIVKARPVKNMSHLSHLYFVGAEALNKLKTAVKSELLLKISA